MNTEEVKELLDWGFDIGGHSVDHLNFHFHETGRNDRTGQDEY